MKRLSLFFSHRFVKGTLNDGPQPIQSAGAAAGTAVRHAGLRAGAGAPVRRPELANPGTSVWSGSAVRPTPQPQYNQAPQVRSGPPYGQALSTAGAQPRITGSRLHRNRSRQ